MTLIMNNWEVDGKVGTCIRDLFQVWCSAWKKQMVVQASPFLLSRKHNLSISQRKAFFREKIEGKLYLCLLTDVHCQAWFTILFVIYIMGTKYVMVRHLMYCKMRPLEYSSSGLRWCQAALVYVLLSRVIIPRAML